MYNNRLSLSRKTNLVHEFADITSDSGVITEPVTRDEFKNYARLQGFEEDNESGEFTLDSDDTLIDELITAARLQLERWTGMSLVPHTWKAWVSNQNGDIELPMSNGATVTEAEDSSGAAMTVTTHGVDYLFVKSPKYADMYITYETDGACPKDMKAAILAEALFRYSNRGDVMQEGDICAKALTLAAKYKRVSTWLQ